MVIFRAAFVFAWITAVLAAIVIGPVAQTTQTTVMIENEI